MGQFKKHKNTGKTQKGALDRKSSTKIKTLNRRNKNQAINIEALVRQNPTTTSILDQTKADH